MRLAGSDEFIFSSFKCSLLRGNLDGSKTRSSILIAISVGRRTQGWTPTKSPSSAFYSYSGNVARHKLSQRMEYVACNMFPDWHAQILREATRGVSTVLYLQHYAKYDIWEDDTRLQLDLP